MKVQIIRYLLYLVVFLMCASCKKYLKETPYGQLTPDIIFNSKEGVESSINAIYASTNGYGTNDVMLNAELSTDISIQSGGGGNAVNIPFQNFTIDASHPSLRSIYWNPAYTAIRDCNILLDEINSGKSSLSDQLTQSFKAEVTFLRAMNYIKLYYFFGPVVLRKSNNEPQFQAKASDDEMKTFIETELLSAIPNLPTTGNEEEYGRVTKEAAQAVLAKFYLNTKQWDKSAALCLELINTGKFSLFPNYDDLFKVENEGNSETIYVNVRSSLERGLSNDIMAESLPPDFEKDPITGLTWQSNWAAFANNFRTLDGFYNSFEPGDKRKKLFLYVYINRHGDTISLLNQDQTRTLKFWPDPNAVGAAAGNDWPLIRYADILLSRAEALNELNGPNQESIDLINMVRKRAGCSLLSLSDFNSKDDLRNELVKERGWEFYTEGLRREDLIRMGKYIEFAIARGKDAKPYQVVYPIPQSAIDANPLLKQNDGY